MFKELLPMTCKCVMCGPVRRRKLIYQWKNPGSWTERRRVKEFADHFFFLHMWEKYLSFSQKNYATTLKEPGDFNVVLKRESVRENVNAAMMDRCQNTQRLAACCVWSCVGAHTDPLPLLVDLKSWISKLCIYFYLIEGCGFFFVIAIGNLMHSILIIIDGMCFSCCFNTLTVKENIDINMA